MRATVQRVLKASVTVGDELVSSIGKGLCILVGISRNDNPKDMEYMVRKILNLRVFEDDQDRTWAKSVSDLNLEILCVSQFTLYAVLKGNKPDFHCSMGGDESKAFYMEFLSQLKKSYKPELIKDGQFGAHMQVHIQNDGPVTIALESPIREQKPDRRQQKKETIPPRTAGDGSAAESTTGKSANAGASAAATPSQKDIDDLSQQLKDA